MVDCLLIDRCVHRAVHYNFCFFFIDRCVHRVVHYDVGLLWCHRQKQDHAYCCKYITGHCWLLCALLEANDYYLLLFV